MCVVCGLAHRQLKLFTPIFVTTFNVTALGRCLDNDYPVLSAFEITNYAMRTCFCTVFPTNLMEYMHSIEQKREYVDYYK